MMDFPNIFEPSDFDIDMHDASMIEIAKQANAILAKKLSEARTVYLKSQTDYGHGESFVNEYWQEENKFDRWTKKAKLICVHETSEWDDFLEALKTTPLKNTENI